MQSSLYSLFIQKGFCYFPTNAHWKLNFEIWQHLFLTELNSWTKEDRSSRWRSNEKCALFFYWIFFKTYIINFEIVYLFGFATIQCVPTCNVCIVIKTKNIFTKTVCSFQKQHGSRERFSSNSSLCKSCKLYMMYNSPWFIC